MADSGCRRRRRRRRRVDVRAQAVASMPASNTDLHSNDTVKFLVYYSTALRLPVPSNCALKDWCYTHGRPCV